MTIASAALVFSACPPLYAQPVLLQIRPRVGDTLAVRLNQTVELTGTPTGCGVEEPLSRRNTKPAEHPRPCSEIARRMTTVMEVFSRAIVRRTSSEGAIILAVTDSIRTSTSAGGKGGTPVRVKGGDDTIELRVSTDGGVEVIDAEASDELRAIFGQMPATLSRKPVAAGEKWMRQMRIPIVGEPGASGLVRATFRLDSLGRNGDMAYISMRGTLSHDHRDGSDSELSGWMSGSMQLDRRLAWITETRATIDVTSMVRPTAGGKPMRVRTKVTQLLRAGPAR
ncbi:MAG: hypothetical protein Q7S20_13425 [Gemmatimonadaceae bacterium]|nr:hypothetical protein [Gemmatimonadaceae bacterium]